MLYPYSCDYNCKSMLLIWGGMVRFVLTIVIVIPYFLEKFYMIKHPELIVE